MHKYIAYIKKKQYLCTRFFRHTGTSKQKTNSLIFKVYFMDKQVKQYVDQFMAELVRKNPGELEFHQAVKEVLESVAPMVFAYPYLREQKVLERMVEPERVIMFRVPWVDDQGEVQVNRGFRVQMNSAIGPY